MDRVPGFVPFDMTQVLALLSTLGFQGCVVAGGDARQKYSNLVCDVLE